MTWVWQRPEWPHFTWDRTNLASVEARFLVGGGVFVGSVGHLDNGEQEMLTVEALSVEGLATSEIEGDILDRPSVQSSIRRHLGLATDHRRTGAAEQGIAEMMVDVHRSFAAPLSDETLFAWHRMVTAGRRDLKDIGCYRRHPEAMQVVSGPAHAPIVHYEAPPSDHMSDEMARFVAWFNRTAPDGPEPLPALTRAGVAHFYFVCIHPFEDGNGRIGRAIAEKALAQGLGRPTLIALAATILAQRRAYYDALALANTKMQLEDWLDWFASMTLEAQRRSLATVEFLIDKARLLNRLGDRMNERQLKALLRILREGPDGFTGGLSAGNYRSITGASPATATRDLADMVAMGALVRAGDRRYARYQANVSRPSQEQG